MLQIALAGLVLQGVISEEEAEKIFKVLAKKKPPKTVAEVLEAIRLAKE